MMDANNVLSSKTISPIIYFTAASTVSDILLSNLMVLPIPIHWSGAEKTQKRTIERKTVTVTIHKI